jgi:hypothetical protein
MLLGNGSFQFGFTVIASMNVALPFNAWFNLGLARGNAR